MCGVTRSTPRARLQHRQAGALLAFDRTHAVGRPFARRKAPKVEQDMRRVFDDPEIDVVSIATPNHWHSLAAIWAPPFVADGKVYLVDEDGDTAIFYARANPHAASGAPNEEPAQMPIKPVREISMLSSCYTQPTASKGVLFIANKDYLFAIQREP